MDKIKKVLNYQPADIRESDIDNPISGMNYFFVNHPLHESREKLWRLYEGWIYLASESPDGEELKDMIFFSNSLIEMLNLCFVFTEKNKEVRE
ncbi:hypothetical protein [Pedobacter sp. ASV28]|uniref:hypothetical protein n=1 Tax=Pedobacter sp. ASV28 TaxID=2795123 RepID=UPI0018EB04C4|nr:hypothetical protein [Pedobacter sp. ASV28]